MEAEDCHESLLLTRSDGSPAIENRPGGDVTEISVIVPVYNEADNISQLYERVREALDSAGIDAWELIFALDPCTDGSEKCVLGIACLDSRVKMLRFSRRRGQSAATIAGLAASEGEACVLIDCDLQDPPEVIPELIKTLRAGHDVVYAQRRSREGETRLKLLVAAAGYRLIRRVTDIDLPVDTGDFRIMSRRVVNEVLRFRETDPFIKGLVPFIGFSQTGVLYDRASRLNGEGKYNRYVGSINGGLHGVFGFSRYPLQLISISGIVMALISALIALIYALLAIAGIKFPIGNPTVVVSVWVIGSVQLLSLGVMGEYIGRIYDESKRRPRWIVSDASGLSLEALDRVREVSTPT
jgi:dolichol-phosphate mannosyltransferase